MLSDWMNTIIFCTAMVCIAKIICVCTICGTLEKIKESKGSDLFDYKGKKYIMTVTKREESDTDD